MARSAAPPPASGFGVFQVMTQDGELFLDIRSVRYWKVAETFEEGETGGKLWAVAAYFNSKDSLLAACYRTHRRAKEVLRDLHYAIRNGDAYDFVWPERGDPNDRPPHETDPFAEHARPLPAGVHDGYADGSDFEENTNA